VTTGTDELLLIGGKIVGEMLPQIVRRFHDQATLGTQNVFVLQLRLLRRIFAR